MSRKIKPGQQERLIALSDETTKALKYQALDMGLPLKNYIELLLTSKAKKP